MLRCSGHAGRIVLWQVCRVECHDLRGDELHARRSFYAQNLPLQNAFIDGTVGAVLEISANIPSLLSGSMLLEGLHTCDLTATRRKLVYTPAPKLVGHLS